MVDVEVTASSSVEPIVSQTVSPFAAVVGRLGFPPSPPEWAFAVLEREMRGSVTAGWRLRGSTSGVGRGRGRVVPRSQTVRARVSTIGWMLLSGSGSVEHGTVIRRWRRGRRRAASASANDRQSCADITEWVSTGGGAPRWEVPEPHGGVQPQREAGGGFGPAALSALRIPAPRRYLASRKVASIDQRPA